MNSPDPGRPSARDERVVFWMIVLLAFGLRLQGVFHDLPFSFYGDELHFVKRAMSLGAGDLNPHWFHKPAFLMYLLLGSFGMYFLGGRAIGTFDSVEAFGASFLMDAGPFLLIGRLLVLAFGVATVVVGYRIGRRVSGVESARTTALFLAILPAMVASSQVVKADVPSAFFVTAAVWAYLKTRDGHSLRWLAVASALAGASMGTKYYGVIVVPALVLAELVSHWSTPRRWWLLTRRAAVMAAVFVASFFVTSPYNFLDPLWSDSVRTRLAEISGWEGLRPDGRKEAVVASAPPTTAGMAMPPHALNADAAAADGVSMDGDSGDSDSGDGDSADDYLRFDPDSGVQYERGLGALPGAALHFAGKLVGWRSLGPPFAILALLGVIGLARRPEKRWELAVLALPVLVFALFASTIAAYHTNPRQLNAIFPLFGPLLYPGARELASWFRARGRLAKAVPALLVALAALPMLQRTLEVNSRLQRPDSRKAAYEWVLANIDPGERILLDDYGPILQPNAAAVSRLRERLAALPGRDAFTEAQAMQLELRAEFPCADGRNIDLLGHPWWMAKEVPDEELRTDPHHRDMGNPLYDRVPRTVAAYREIGYRWVISNSEARDRYYDDERDAGAFPSFRRFYDALDRETAVATFDPAELGGKGPVVRVYRLDTAADDG
ncbi:glycosyltransferase family 39 protein [bacterium]|nr:glycosyltransferase family 39 protein [bacterium]